MKTRDFKGAVVVITGAGGGLGRAMARQFAAAGARIGALDRDEAGLAGCVTELSAAGAECSAQCCDVTDAAACARALASVTERFGRIDVLVNNAGISHHGSFAETQLEVIRRVVEINFFGAVHCTKAALPALIASRGLVIAISSVAGFSPLLGRSGYSASKHAMHGLFETLRTEVAPQGVDVMMVCPSFVATDIDRHALGSDGRPSSRPKVVVGTSASPDAVARRIFTAARRRRRLLLVGRVAQQAYWLSRFLPSVYERIMARRLRG
jgi:NAD(P)-dependent dehydrogenase (short-subunit alcohol dehydrogenase family)